MAAGTYTLQNLQDAVNSRVHARFQEVNATDTTIGLTLINAATREVISEIDFTGTERRAPLSSNLFASVYAYPLPADIKGDAIIDLIPQVRRGSWDQWNLTSPEEFDRRKGIEKNLLAISTDDLVNTLHVSYQMQNDSSITAADFETVNADGDTYVGINGVTDSNVKTDAINYVHGNGAVRYMTNAGADTNLGGIQVNGGETIDISSYLAGSAFLWARLTSGDSDISKAYLRAGTDTSNYYLFSDSTMANGAPFQTGQNLISFDLRTRTSVGTPTDTAIDYYAAYFGRTTTTHQADTDNAFDYLTFKKGSVFDLYYYTKYVWQTTATVAYKENATAFTDTLSLELNEIALIELKVAEKVAQHLRDYDDVKIFKQDYLNAKQEYELNNPSKALLLVTSRYQFESQEGRDNRSYGDCW